MEQQAYFELAEDIQVSEPASLFEGNQVSKWLWWIGVLLIKKNWKTMKKKLFVETVQACNYV